MNFFSGTVCRTFDNGLRSFVLPMGGTTVKICCFVATGSIHEGENLGCGLSHFIEHMLFQGCRDYPGIAVSHRAAELGGAFNAYTACDHTVYHIELAATHLDEALKMLAMMVRFPEFTAERFSSEKKVILRECDRTRDSVEWRLYDALTRELYLRHPIRVPVIGYPESITTVDRDMARAYHTRRYTPGRCFFAAAGAIDPERFNLQLEDLLGDWPRGPLIEPVLENEPEVAAPREAGLCFPDAVERLSLAVRLPDVTDPRFPAFDVLFGVLGTGDGSRLARRLKLEKELALDLSGFCFVQAGSGVAGIGAAVRPGGIGRLEKALSEELDRLGSKLTDAEIDREKRQQYADRLRRFRDQGNAVSELGAAVLRGGSPCFGDLYSDRIAAVTSDEVRAAADWCLAPEKRVTVRQRVAAPRLSRAAATHCAVRLETLQTDSGAKLVWVPDHRLPLVEFSLLLPGGAIFEPSGLTGASSLAGALLNAGTLRRKEAELLAKFDSLGADFGTVNGFNSFSVTLSVPRRSFGAAFRLLTEVLTASRFGEAEFARERTRITEELNSRNWRPRSVALRRARELTFGIDHPYAIGSDGTTVSLAGLTAAAVKEYFYSRFVVSRTMLGFSGDCTEAEAAAWANELCSQINWRSTVEPAWPEAKFPDVVLRDEIELDRDQSVTLRMFPGTRLGNGADRLACSIFYGAENGLASRLFERVREDNALAYSVGLDMMGGFRRGCFGFYAATEPTGLDRVEALISDELEHLAASGLNEKEFSAARERLLFEHGTDLGNCRKLLESALLDLHYGLDAACALRVVDDLRAISLAEVNLAVTGYCRAALNSGAIVRAGKLKKPQE